MTSSGGRAPDSPDSQEFESLAAQLKYKVAKKDKKKGLLSDGEPANPEKDATPAGGQLAAKAFEALKSHADNLLKQTQSRPDPTERAKSMPRQGGGPQGSVRRLPSKGDKGRPDKDEIYPHQLKKIDLDREETYKDAQPSDWYECFT